jgi:uncharacterized phage protein gp47/JayE
MPFERPTLTALAKQAVADVAAAAGTFTLLRTSPLAIVAKAATGLVHGVYGYIDWLSKQAIPATATDEYLYAWAALVGIEQKGAATATATVTFTGVPGAVMPDGTVLARTADGVTFRTTALATVDEAGSLTVAAEAAEAGALGNALAGAEVVISAAITGINSTGIFSTAATGGADEEPLEDFRQRMLDRYRTPPQGGAESDYVAWALQVPGVTRAWAAPNAAGAGTVVVYVMLDDARAVFDGFPQGTDGVAADEPRGTPATGDQLTVADHIFPLRPVTALVYVVAPEAFGITVSIEDLSEDTAEIRDAIEASLIGMFRRRGRPGGTIYPSEIAAAIDGTPGVERFTLSFPTTPIAAPDGHLPVLGQLNWS